MVGKKSVKVVTEARVEERRWDADDYYSVVQVQVSGSEGFHNGDRVRVTIEKI